MHPFQRLWFHPKGKGYHYWADLYNTQWEAARPGKVGQDGARPAPWILETATSLLLSLIGI